MEQSIECKVAGSENSLSEISVGQKVVSATKVPLLVLSDEDILDFAKKEGENMQKLRLLLDDMMDGKVKSVPVGNLEQSG